MSASSTTDTPALGRGSFAAMVTALMASQLVGTVCALLPPAIAPAIAAGHDLPVVLIGSQSSLMFGGMAVTLTFGSNLSQRWGGCRAIQIGMVLMAIGAAMATVGHVALLVAGSLVMGFGYGFITPSNTRILRRFTPPAIRNIVFSLVQAGVPIGVLIASTAGPAITVAIDWRAALWACGALCLVLCAALQPGRETWDSDRDATLPRLVNPLMPLGVTWGVPPLRLLAFAGGTLACGQVIIHSYTVAMFYEQLSLPLVQAGLMLMTAQVGAVFARPFWGWLADRTGDCLGVLTILAALMSVTALASATLGLGWPTWATVLLFVAFGCTASGWHGAYLGEVAKLAPQDNVTTATSGALIIIHLSSIITPLIFAAAYAFIHSYSLAFGLLVIPSVASIALLRAARRSARQAHP
jgi:MFS family permease